jgi:nucleotide-binding universal stress UspA family protein
LKVKVFFAVDGSTHSLAAVRQVGSLLSAERDSAALYFAPPDVIIRHAEEADAMRERAQQAICDAVLGAAIDELPDALAAGVTKIIQQHTPREGILMEAQKWGAELIVCGARGLGPVERLLLGNVSQSVAQTAPIPVFVVRPNPGHRPDQPLRILYAYDGSAGSTAALRTAQRFTYAGDTQVTAMTVIEPLAVTELPDWIVKRARDADTEAMAKGWEREHAEERRQAADQLKEFMSKQPAPFDKAETIVAEGHAADQILKIVKERWIDMIIVGSHGKNAFQRMLIGSTSDNLLNNAHSSVLIGRATT